MKLPFWFRFLPFPTSLKHIAGSAWMMKGRLFALGAIVALGFAIFVGALSAIDSIFQNRERWDMQGHLADLELRVVADDVTNFPRFDDIAGVMGYRLRMIFPASINTGKNSHL